MIAPAPAGCKAELGSASILERAENLFDVDQAFLVVLALEFKPGPNPHRVPNAMLG